MLSAMSPHYKNLKNTLPASAGTTTRDLVGFFIYIITYLPMIVFIKPHKLEKFMWPAFIGTVATVFGIMGWAVAKNGGSPGNLVSPAIALSASARGFRFVQCISSVCGTYGGAADRFADVSISLLHEVSILISVFLFSGLASLERRTTTSGAQQPQCQSL